MPILLNINLNISFNDIVVIISIFSVLLQIKKKGDKPLINIRIVDSFKKHNSKQNYINVSNKRNVNK